MSLHSSPLKPVQLSSVRPFVEKLTDSIFRDERLQRCLNNQGESLILQGKMGVGKTMTMLGILKRLDQLREAAAEEKQKNLNDATGEQLTREQETNEHEMGKQEEQEQELEELFREITDRLHDAEEHETEEQEQERQTGVLPSMPSDVVVASVFFNGSEQEKHDAAQILMWVLQSLVQQIPNSMRHVKDLYEKSRNAGPSAENIAAGIISVLERGNPACIFLDALDECFKPSLQPILRQLKVIQDATKVGLVMTDRLDTSKWQNIFDESCGRILSADERDVRDYLKACLDQLSSTNPGRYTWAKGESHRTDVISVITKSSGGM